VNATTEQFKDYVLLPDLVKIMFRTCRFCGEVMELHDDSEFDPNHICLPEPESTIQHVRYERPKETNGNNQEK